MGYQFEKVLVVLEGAVNMLSEGITRTEKMAIEL
jgi:hypothetical protein